MARLVLYNIYITLKLFYKMCQNGRRLGLFSATNKVDYGDIC